MNSADISADLKFASDLTTIKAAEGWVSECPEEQDCLVKLLGYLYAITHNLDHKKLDAWCLQEMSYGSSLQEEAEQWNKPQI